MKKLLTVILALGAMAAGIMAGHLFYLEKFMAGIAMLIMTLIFLSYSMSSTGRVKYSENYDDDDEDLDEEDDDGVNDFIDTEKVVGDMALLISEMAVNNFKNIGRTIPPSIKEITELEEKLNALLNKSGVPFGKREVLNEEFNKLKGRTRLNDGGAAIMRNSRL